MGTGTLYTGIKWPERESVHSPPSSAEVKIVELYIYYPYMPSWCGQGKFTGFYLYLYHSLG